MRTTLTDFALVHDDDLIRMLDGGKPVRDHDRRPAFHQFPERLRDQALRLRVNVRRRLVQHKDCRLVRKRARKG